MAQQDKQIRRPKLVPVRSYNQIVALLTKETAQRIAGRKMPEFTLGAPSRRMLALAKRLTKAKRIVDSTTAQLRRLGADVDYGKLSLHYSRKNQLQTEWRASQQAAHDKLQGLKLQALVDLTDMEPREAKVYLTGLRAKLGRL